MTIENWDLGVQDRYMYHTGKDFRLPLTLKDLSRKRNGFLVLFFVFSLGYHVFSGVSLIKYSGRTTETSKRLPWIFRKNTNSFFCTFEQERRFKLLKKRKFNLCSKKDSDDPSK